MQRHNDTKQLDRQKRETQQLQDLMDGRGYSSDKILARFYGCTRKTIWCWAKDGKLPKPQKLGDNTTRWNNAELKEMGCLS